MMGKLWYQSKGMVGSLLASAVGIVQLINGVIQYFQANPDQAASLAAAGQAVYHNSEAVITILAGALAAYGRAKADPPILKKVI